MNLDDRIRASARSQSDRYQGSDDLFARIEHRRRQRAARRVTVGAAAAVVLFGTAAVALASLRDRGDDTDVASPTELTVEDTLQPPTTPATTAPAVTAPSSTAATTTSTTEAPHETSPVQVPVDTTPRDADVPSPSILADGTTGIAEFWNVPRYGSEAVRGSGCGSSGQLGDTIPDGIWAGYIVGDGSDGVIDIDVACVYLPEAAAGVLANPNASIVNDDPNYLIVNNSTRTRPMPLDHDIVLRLAERDAAGRCLDSHTTTHWADIPADRQVWVRIHAGRVTWMLADCAT